MKCRNCEEPISGNRQFCSRGCSTSYRNKKGRKERISITCPTCGIQFEGLKDTPRPRKFCSRSCSTSHKSIGNTYNLGMKHTDETKKKISDSMSWDKNPHWKGGVFSYKYRAIEHRGHECINCDYEDKVEVHHLNGDRSNNEMWNLAVMCEKCHKNKGHIFLRDDLGQFAGIIINEEYRDSVYKERGVVGYTSGRE